MSCQCVACATLRWRHLLTRDSHKNFSGRLVGSSFGLFLESSRNFVEISDVVGATLIRFIIEPLIIGIWRDDSAMSDDEALLEHKTIISVPGKHSRKPILQGM